ncbi:tyrosinase family protein, partial [Phenylobacterium sp.]|uniref:tyrosinase family protein n=1 Tax=Phenylobacterium sp. TaxID=1871053 RepID=UPI0037C84B1A
RAFLETTAVGGALVLGGVAMRAFAQTIPVRRDVNTIISLGRDDLQKYAEAVRILKSRAVGTSNTWFRNAVEHRDYCASLPSGPKKEIHGTWWFLPWHRAYLASTEMSLRAALGDATFALPYWHWPLTASIPAPFRTGALDHPGRRMDPVPAYVMDLTAMSRDSFRGRRNAAGRLLDVGMGGWGPTAEYASRSAIEGTPHGAIHNAVGGDMGALDTAARDPLFFAHHGNLDRLWEVWRTPNDGTHAATEPWTDPMFEREFVFATPEGPPRTIKVSQTRRTEDLGYRYEPPRSEPGPPSAAVVSPARRPPEPPAEALAPATNRSGPLAVLDAGPSPPGPGSRPLAANARAFLRLVDLETPVRGVMAAVYLQKRGAGGFDRTKAAYVGVLGVVGYSDRSFRADFALEATEAVRELGDTQVEAFLLPIQQLGYRAPLTLARYELQVAAG